MTSMNEQNMGIVGDKPVQAPELVAIVCIACNDGFVSGDGIPTSPFLRICVRCDGQGSVLINKSKLKVIS